MSTLPPHFNKILLQAGIMAGIIKGPIDHPTFNSNWFSDPLTELEKITGGDLEKLLEALFGALSGAGVGAAVNTLHREWFPIPIPKKGGGFEDLGLYLVAYTDPQKNTIWGPGFLKEIKEGAITIAPFAIFPVVQMPAQGGKPTVVLGKSKYPIEIGVEIVGSNGIFGSGKEINDVSFDGIQASVNIDFSEAPKLELVLQNLKLPGEKKGSDRSLEQLIAEVPIAEWIETAFSILGAQLSKMNNKWATEIGQIIQNVLHVIGINSNLPSIDWEAISSKGINIFKDWLRAVVSSPKIFKDWLNNWAKVFLSPEKFSGLGTPSEPFKIPIHKSATVGTLNFTVAVSSAGKNAYNIYPGFELDSIPFNPITALKDKFQLFIQADFDLFELQLPATDDAKVPFGLSQFFPMLEVMIAANNPTPGNTLTPLISLGNAGTNDYLKIDEIRGGLSYSNLGAKGGQRHLHPTFELLNANIMGGTFPIIDLTNFKKDVQIAKQAISTLIKDELEKIAALSPLAGSLASILGLIPPSSFGSGNGKWQPTLLIDEIENLIEHPLKAWGVYYSQCLSQKDNKGNYLWPYLLPDFAALLHGSGTSVNYNGGTVNDPWQITLDSLGDKVMINLEAWQGQTPGDELAIGLGVLVPFSIGSFEFDFELSANLFELNLPTSFTEGSFGAFWLPGVDATLRLPSFNQPLAANSIAAKELALIAGWHRTKDLYFDALINGLNIDLQPFPNIEFGTDTTNWKKELGTIASAFTLLMGMELTLFGGKGGATLAALLGLNPEAFQKGTKSWIPPKGISFPVIWPKIDVSDPATFFTSPWQDLRSQIKQVFSKGDVAIPLMQLIGWTITGKVPVTPSATAVGSAADPWVVKFENGLEPFVFKSDEGVGFGMEYQLKNWTTKEFSFDSTIALGGFSIGTTDTYDFGFDPVLSLNCTFTNPKGKQTPLISGSKDSLQIGWATLGLGLDKKGVAIPILKLMDSGINTTKLIPVITLSLDPNAAGSYISSHGLQLLESLLNGLMEHLSASLQGQSIPGLQAFLNILDLFGILQTQSPTAKQTNPIYSFNPTSWIALLANPLNYFAKQSEQVLSTPTGTTKLYSNLLTLIGKPNFVIPPAIEGILIFLEVLGLIEKKKAAYFVNFSSWMTLINHPLQFLEGLPLNAEKNILNDPALQKQLTAALSHLPKPQNKYGLQLSLLTGNKIRFGLPVDAPLNLGLDLGLDIAIIFDLKNDALSIDLTLSETAIGLDLTLEGGLDFTSTKSLLTWAVGLQASVPPGVPPASIGIYHNGEGGENIDIDALILQVPLFILSTTSAYALNNFLLPKSPLLQNIIVALGLDLPKKQKGIPVVGSISSILQHPFSWLMHILGNGDGKIDLSKVGKILNELPGAAGITGPGNIKLTQFQDYGLELAVGTWGDIKFSANDQRGITIELDAFPPIPENKLLKRVAISPVLNFGADGGIHVSGDLSVTLQLKENSAFIPLGPDPNQKSLTTHFSYHKSVFGLSLFGVWKGKHFGPVNILPFHGLSQFLEQSFISTVEPVLINELKKGPPIGQELAAVFGIIPPKAADAPSPWPLIKSNGMLLSPSQLGSLIHNPLAALGGYYTRTLNTYTNLDGNKVALFPFMLENFAAIFKGVGKKIDPTAGLVNNPWEIDLYQIGDIIIRLQAWQPTGTVEDLVFALSVFIPISIRQTLNLDPELQLQILHLELPNDHNTGGFHTHWMPSVNGQVKVSAASGSLSLSKLKPLGIDASLEDLNFLFGWKPKEGVYFDALIEKLIVNQSAFPTLIFGTDTADWKSELESLGIIILNIIGANLVAHGGNTGIMLSAALGLVEDMPAVFKNTNIWKPPAGISFPTTWPHFTTRFPKDFFTDPWTSIRSQLFQVFSNQESVIPLVQLFFWNFTNKVPSTSGTGTTADPWIIDLPGSLDLSLEIWKDENSIVQFAIGKKLNEQTDGNINIESIILLEGIGIGNQSSIHNPFVDLHLRLTNSKGNNTPIYSDSTTGLTLGAINLGVSFGIKGISPILGILQSKLTAAGKLQDYFLTPTDIANAFGSAQGLHLLEALLNEIIVFFSKEAKSGKGKAIPALMNIGQLFQLLNVDDKVYTLNDANWENMLSNPPAYFLVQTEHIFITPALFNQVIIEINTLTSLNLPTITPGVEDLFFAFGLMDLAHTSATTTTLVFSPSKFMELIHHPVEYLNHLSGQIINNKAVINHLIAGLQAAEGSLPTWMTIPKNSTKSIDIQFKYVIHKLVDLEANLILDFASKRMTAEASIGIDEFPTALVFSDTYKIGKGIATNSWALSLAQISANLPVPVGQITLISNEQLVPNIIQLLEEIPLQLLTSFIRFGLNEYLFPNSQLAINIFKGLKLFDGEKLGPLYPIVAHPIQWLESEFENSSGGVNWENIGTLLNNIPGSAGFHGPSNKINLIKYKTTGLEIQIPKWINFVLFSDDTGINLAPTFNPSIAPEITIAADIGFKTSLALTGKAAFTFELDDSKTIGVELDYDNGIFEVNLDGLLSGNEKFPLFPFTSFAKVISSAAGTEAILSAVLEVAEVGFKKYSAKYPQGKLTIFIQDLVKIVNSFNINSFDQLYTALSKLIEDPTIWITTWFTTKITTAIADLHKVVNILTLQKYFPPSSSNLLVFKPSTSIPINIEFGERKLGTNEVVGVWVTATVNVPTENPLFTFTLNQTGVGLQTPIGSSPVFDISFEIDCTINLPNIVHPKNPGLPSPTISFGYDEKYFPGQFFILLYPKAKTVDSNNTKLVAKTSEFISKVLVINFLPKPQLSFGANPSIPADVGSWLFDFALDFMVPMLADIVLDTQFVTKWLNQPVNNKTQVTRGAIPVSWGLLTDNENYALDPGFYITKKKPLAIVEKVIYQTFKTLLSGQSSFPIFTFAAKPPRSGEGSISIIKDNSNNYGIGVAIKDLAIKPKSGKGVEVDIQLGQWMKGGSESDNWLTKSGTKINGDPAGLNFYLVNGTNPNAPSIVAPIIELESIGIDLKGAGGLPLFNVKGYDLEDMEFRIYLYLDTSDLDNIAFGFGLRGDNFGMPLGPPSTKSGSKTNPVAQNLLSSGKEKKSGSSNAVNPSFSFLTAYSKGFILKFYNANDDPEDEVWIVINKKFGPLDVRQIGAGYVQKKQDVLLGFDGSVSLAGLDLDLQKLTIGIPITHPQDLDDYTLDLQGVDLTFNKGSVDISGGLFKIMPPHSTTPDYDGNILLKAGSLNLAALGAYTVINKHPSFFMFLTLDIPLGGPEFFFVTGLAAGFGFNRNLILPGQNEVRDFPLVAGAMGASNFPGGDDPGKALLVMENYIPPDIGEYWLAAGIKFNSFELINSFALLTVSFGTEFQIGLIGISRLAIPSGISSPIAQAELDMEVIFNPTIGILTATAVINPDSFLLSRDCKLQGGFAFYIWFKDQPPPKGLSQGAKGGSFVVTLGGYNSAFIPKPWFPKEPRLGFNWKVSNEMNIKGGIYFALTNHAIMAGGGLQAVFATDPIRVWFTVYADFLMYWAPFGFEIDAGITIGASLIIDIFGIKIKLTIELGASIKLEGNPFQGVAKVHIFVFTITVHFGSKDKLSVKPLSWEEFAQEFLPKATKKQAQFVEGATANTTNPLLKLNISKGLIKQVKTKSGEVYNIVNAQELSILTDASIPSTKLIVNGVALTPKNPVPEISVNPMQQEDLQWQATHEVTIVNIENSNYKPTFKGVVQTRNIPASLWGKYKPGSVTPEVNPKTELIENAPVGAEIKPFADTKEHEVGPIELATLHKDVQLKPKTIVRGELTPSAPGNFPGSVFKQIQTSLSDPNIQTARAAILSTLQATETIDINVDVSLLAAYPQIIFRGTPILSDLGDLPE